MDDLPIKGLVGNKGQFLASFKYTIRFVIPYIEM